MLWTLWNRAADAAGTRPLLRDPMAIDLVDRISYDFHGTFGKPNIAHAVRSRFADELIRDFLRRNDNAVVVALGEGLETQFWRVDDGRVRWFSVDLPEAIGVRRRLLPSHPRNVLLECSALDVAWLAAVPHDAPVFVSAAGLFMYFRKDQVIALLRSIAQRLPGGEMFFDTIPPWFSRKTLKGLKLTARYTMPPMPFALPLPDTAVFLAGIPGVQLIDAVGFAEPYPDRMRLFALLSRIRAVRDRLSPGLVHIRF